MKIRIDINIDNTARKEIKRAYRERPGSTKKLEKKLNSCGSIGELYRDAATIYYSLRNNPVVFVYVEAGSFDHLKIMSSEASPELIPLGFSYSGGRAGHLAGRALACDVIVHIPDISEADRRSMMQIYSESGRETFFSDQMLTVDFWSNKGEKKSDSFGSSVVRSPFPRSLKTGAVLITPISGDLSIPVLIWEYQGHAFTPEAIQEARDYAAVFAWEIAQRVKRR